MPSLAASKSKNDSSVVESAMMVRYWAAVKRTDVCDGTVELKTEGNMQCCEILRDDHNCEDMCVEQKETSRNLPWFCMYWGLENGINLCTKKYTIILEGTTPKTLN